MAALDTNILVRFLIDDDDDDAAQLAAARRLIRRCITAGETLFVPVTVALEIEWVLRSSFGFDKPTAIAREPRLKSLLDEFVKRLGNQ